MAKKPKPEPITEVKPPAEAEETLEIPEVPDEIKRLLMDFRDKREINEQQLATLFEFLGDQKIMPLVMSKSFRYTKRDYDRLNKAMLRKGIGERPPKPERELMRLEAKDYREFIQGLWDDAKNIGTMTVQRWLQRASELGYFDETTNKVDMPGFVEDACDFFLKNYNRITELEQEALANKAMAAMLAEAVNKLTQKITLVDAQLGYLEQSYPQLKYSLIPLRVLTNIESYKPKEVA